MAFIITGEGKRTAVSSRGKSKDATKLIVIADAPINEKEKPVPKHDYKVDLVFAAPSGSESARIFDVWAQDKLFAENFEVASNETNSATLLSLPRVKIGESLKLKFVAKEGKPVLCGVQLKKHRKLATQ